MKKLWILLLNLLFCGAILAQTPDTLILIDDSIPISSQQFIYMFKKNNFGKDSVSVKKYLQLFINYKLKVIQAERLGYNKRQNFKNEYYKYLLDAAQGQFVNYKLQNQYLHKLFHYLQKEVKFRFIVRALPHNATPQDTAKVYNFLLKLRSQIINGADFSALALKYSNDPNVRYTKGTVNYVIIFDLPYKFVQFLWNNPPGTVSMPIRLYNYYYIFQVLDTRPNQGQIHVAQIFIPLPANHTPADSAKAYNLIHKVDSLLKHGAQFSKVAQKYSQDFRSAVRGGDIGWIHSGQTVPAFEQAAFSIKKIGQVVGPVQTNLGFHFIKLLGRKSYSNYDSVKPLLLNYFKSTPYYKLIYSSVIDSLKKVYHFKQLGSLDTIRNHLSNDLFKGRWSDSTLINNTNPLCQIQNQICTYRDFALWLKHNLHPYPPQNMDKLAQTLFNNFVSYRIKLYHVLQLAKNQNTPFGQLANEFYEGLLLFNISNDSVWQKAASDSIGLKKFYQQNASKYNNLQYISVFNVKTKKDKRKLIRLLKKIHPQIADSSLLTHLQDTNITFVTKKLISAKTDKKFNFVFQTLKKHPDKKIISSPDGHTIVYLNYKFPQIRGLVIADYQDWLEKQWINHLRKQHKIYINYSLLNKIETQLKNQNHKHQ